MMEENDPLSLAERNALRRAEGQRTLQNPSLAAQKNWRCWIFDNLTSRKWFDTFILLTILLNCVTLALANPSKDDGDAVIRFTDRAEIFFAVVFTAEMLLKFAALGFFHEHGYFRDPWNRLDFVIVVSGFLNFLPGVSNFTAIRTLRVLRPLRAVNNMRGLRVIVRTLLASVSALGDAAVLILFLMSVYAIVGLQLWAGNLRQQCFAESDTAFARPLGAFCTGSAGGHRCAAGTVCAARAPAPNEGLTGFDNMAQALLTVLTTSTLSDWSVTMFAVADTSNDFTFVYFITIVLVVSYFAVNLVLAVVSDVFGDLNGESKAEDRAEKKDARARKTRARRRESMMESRRSVIATTSSSSVEMALPGIDEASPSPVSPQAVARTQSLPSNAGGPPSRSRSLSSLPPELLSRTLTDDEALLALDEHERRLRSTVVERLRSAIAPKTAQGRRRKDSAVEPPQLKSDELLEAVAPVLDAARLEFELQMNYLDARPRFFSRVHALVTHPFFSRLIVAAIVANTVTLAVEHHGMSDALGQRLDAANAVFTFVFLAEMALKLVALGPAGYARDSFNVFDGVIVCFSVVEFVAGGGGALSVLRTFRLLRILRLAKSQKSLRILLDTVVGSLGSIGYMSAVLFLFLFMFAVLGMQLFAGKWDNVDEDDRPRSSFDNFYWSFLTVFQMTTGDDWTGLMTAGVRATGTQGAVVYFLVTTLVGAFIILNLFIAILLSNFEDQDDEHFELQDLEEEAERVASADDYDEAAALQELAGQLADARLRTFNEVQAKEAALRESRRPARMEGRSFGVFSRRSRVRRFCWGLVHTWQFQWFIIAAIVANCVLLAMENPGVDGGSSLGRALFVADNVFVVVFTAEMLVKMCAMGVYRNERGAYFQDRWNSLDAFVVATALLSVVVPSFAVARSFRALRPVRVVVRSEQIRVVITSLYRALPAIFNVALFCLIFWLIFGILGVSLFGGLFYSCDGDAALDRAACEAAGLRWANAETHFDHLGASMLTLFQVGTLSGWNDVMYLAVDATSVDEAPRRDAQPQAAVFFLLFIVVCAFFAMSLLTGVVVDNFNRLKSEFDGSAFLTEEQRHWVATRKLLRLVRLDASVDAPANPVRRACYDLCTHPRFDPFVMACIVLNVVVMMTQHFRQPEEVTDVQFGFNLFFTVVFAVEAAVKITALGFSLYWKDSWNRFDFVLVVASVVGVAFDAGVGASVLRVFRIGRVLRLIKRAKTLKQMFETLVTSLPALWNIAFLLFIVFFIFAVVGVAAFGSVDIDDDTGINRDTNFKDFGHAMLTLYVLAAGDKWEEVMWGARDEARGGSRYAPAYFILFLVLGMLVMIELYVAVILENFSNAGDDMDGSTRENLEKMDQFREAWARRDPLATSTLPASQIEGMMSDAPLPFGFGRQLSRVRVLSRLRQARIAVSRRPARGAGPRGYEWRAEFRPTLERVAQALTLGDAEEAARAGAGEDEDAGKADGSGGSNASAAAAAEDLWECSCWKRCRRLREDVTSATMAEWYAVHIIELNWLERRQKATRRRRSMDERRARGEPLVDPPSRVVEI